MNLRGALAKRPSEERPSAAQHAVGEELTANAMLAEAVIQSGGGRPVRDGQVANMAQTSAHSSEFNVPESGPPISATAAIGALRVNRGDRLRLALLAGVGFLAVLLVLTRLKGGSAPAPTVRPPVDQAMAASGSVFAEDMVIQLANTPGVGSSTATYVPGVGPVVALELNGVALDELGTWLADVLVAVATKVPAGLMGDQAVFLVQADGEFAYTRTVVVPLASLDDPSGYSLNSAVTRLRSGGDVKGSSSATPASAPQPSPVAGEATTIPSSVPNSSLAPTTALEETPSSGASSPSQSTESAVGSDAGVSADGVPEGSATSASVGAIGTMERFDSASTAWKPLAGQWRFADGMYSQLDSTGFDFITQYGPELPASFEISAKFVTESELNAGFMLFQPKKGSRNNSILVDITDKGSYVRWGHYDSGGVYVFDGGNKLAAPVVGAQGVNFKVTYSSKVVRIYINDKQVGEFTPSTEPTGPTYSGIVSSVTTFSVDDFLLASR